MIVKLRVIMPNKKGFPWKQGQSSINKGVFLAQLFPPNNL